MATHIGMDLVEVDEVRGAIATHGDRYLQRVFTTRELAESAGRPRRLAACFAAKEATMKALGRRDEAFGWRSIELAGVGTSMPTIRLHEQSAVLARRRGATRLAVTITHQRDHAAAIVISKGDR